MICCDKILILIVALHIVGLETNRPNLLLGLVIRQRPKRDFGVILPSDVSEAPSFLAESKPHVDYPQKAPAAQDMEQSFISALASTRKKDTADLIKSVVEEPILDTETEENVSLHFLPGVLKLPGNAASSLSDTVKSDSTTTVAKTPTVDNGNHADSHPKPTVTAPRLDRFIIKKKDPKAVKTEQAPSSLSLETNSEKKESGVILSLSDKPADVSTESFLSSLTAAKPKDESVSGSTAATASQETSETTSSDVLKDFVNDDSSSVPKNETVSSPTTSLKTSPGILKTPSSSAEPTELKPQQPESNSEKKVTQQPESNSEKKVTPQSSVQPPQESKAIEDIQAITTISSIGKNEGPKQSRTSSFNPKVYNPAIFHSYHAGPPDPQYYPPPANPAPFLPLQSQVPLPFLFPPGPPPPQMFPQSDPHILTPPWPQTVPPQTLPAPPLTYESSLPTSSPLSKDEKGSEKSCGDMGDKPSRRSDETYRKDNRDRDHYDRHHHKSRHYDRDREKHGDRSHSHKERHSKEDRYDRQRERHHSSSHSRDRDKNRRDSDSEKHRRDSRDRRL